MVLTAFGQAAGDGNQIELVQQARDLGPNRWVIAAAIVAAWLALFGINALRVRPRRVPAGRDELDLVGDERPAVVNLLTDDWSLEKEAASATLLDLAARGEVALRRSGDRLVVHAPAQAEGDEQTRMPVLPYERMVLEHVRRLASRTSERTVPAAALTTGAGHQARVWWRRFRTAVRRDAVQRGLARLRWSRRRRLLLALAGIVPAAAVGFAFALTVYEDQTETTDSGVLGATAVYGVMLLVALVVFVATRSGVADTSEGREVASRWLGLRATLAGDPRMTHSQPSDVDVWGRKLAYAAAMGLAREAVQGLPMGGSSHRRAWSAFGGSWRPVRIRYPRAWGGLHPAAAVLIGLGLTAPPVLVLWVMSQSGVWDSSGAGVVLPALIPFVVIAVPGAWALVQGLLDFVTPRRTVEGQVLRIRRKRSSKSEHWYAAVDDGTSERIRAWWLPTEPAFGEGAIVRAEVSKHLGHAKNIEVLSKGGSGRASTGTGWYERLVKRSNGESDQPAASAAAPHEPSGDLPAGLPEPTTVGELIGREVKLDTNVPARASVAALDGRTATYRADTDIVTLTWVDRQTFDRYGRGLPFFRRRVEGVGDEARYLRLLRTLMVRKGDAAIAVSLFLLKKTKQEQGQIRLALARRCLDLDAELRR